MIAFFRKLPSSSNLVGLRTTFRTMSTNPAPTLQRFFVYAPDQTDVGAFQRRLAVRPVHLEAAKKRIGDGFIRETISLLDCMIHRNSDTDHLDF